VTSRVLRETVWHNPGDEDFVIDVGNGSVSTTCDAGSMSGLGAGVALHRGGAPTRYVVPAGGEAVLPAELDRFLSGRLERVGEQETTVYAPTIGAPRPD
jgi:hypothetical protein